MRTLEEMSLDELRTVYDVETGTGEARAAWAERRRRPLPATPPRWLARSDGRLRFAQPENALFPSRAARARREISGRAADTYARAEAERQRSAKSYEDERRAALERRPDETEDVHNARVGMARAW